LGSMHIAVGNRAHRRARMCVHGWALCHPTESRWTRRPRHVVFGVTGLGASSPWSSRCPRSPCFCRRLRSWMPCAAPYTRVCARTAASPSPACRSSSAWPSTVAPQGTRRRCGSLWTSWARCRAPTEARRGTAATAARLAWRATVGAWDTRPSSAMRVVCSECLKPRCGRSWSWRPTRQTTPGRRR